MITERLREAVVREVRARSPTLTIEVINYFINSVPEIAIDRNLVLDQRGTYWISEKAAMCWHRYNHSA
jgi:hypothetical protein